MLWTRNEVALIKDSNGISHLDSLINELLSLSAETTYLELKQDNADKEMIGRNISALSNSAALYERESGYLLWGIHDKDHSIVGTAFDPFKAKVGNQNLINWLSTQLQPQMNFEFIDYEMDGKRLVLLEVGRAPGRPVRFKNDAFIRVGNYTKNLKDHANLERNLWRKFETTKFESGVATHNVEGSRVLELLDFPAYFELMEMPLPTGSDQILDMLERDRIVERTDSAKWSITNLGAILFARDIRQFRSVERKAVRVVQYKGKSRIETIKEQVGVQGYANGFQGMIGYINGLLPRNEFIAQALRSSVTMYPELAIRELVANALIHQDLTISGTGPMIEIFDGRIEITNPGTPLMKPERFIDSPPRSRNEILGNLMRRLRICEERGTGWDKVATFIEAYQLPAPLVEVTNDHTRVTLYSHRELREMDRTERVRAVYLHTVLRYVTHEKVTNTTIRERFGIEKQNSARASNLLKDAVEDGWIAVRNPDAGRAMREYVPFWVVALERQLPRNSPLGF
ncbi:ATP-binding protein [Stackebrandtia endophytica]|nr:ATP-binding protein [Stackebrandtia endophytica]